MGEHFFRKKKNDLTGLLGYFEIYTLVTPSFSES